MSEQFKQLSTPNAQEEGDVLAIVKKIQQHLVYLEKKIDMLVGQQSGGGRPSFGGGGGRPFNKRPFSKPRSFGHDRPQGERNFSQGRPSFGGGDRENRGPREHRGERSGGGNPDSRRPSGGGGGGFGGRKKPWARRER